MTSILTQAQPPLEFIPPRFNPMLLRGLRLILPLWLRWQAHLTQIEASNVATLVTCLQEFQRGKTRLLLAFRHPSPDDMFALAYLLWMLAPQAARQSGQPLQQPVHTHFIYDRGIPLWAGAGVGWLYSHLGGTPIQRGRLDVKGLRSARNLFVNGALPMAAAPEGGNNGHNEIVSALEPGVAQLSFWCADDLRKAGRTETVQIVPLSIQYSYVTPPWQPIQTLLATLEAECGLKHIPLPEPGPPLIKPLPGSQIDAAALSRLYQRLCRLGEQILHLMEDHYRTFYHIPLPKLDSQIAREEDPNWLLAQRLQNLLNAALQVAEAYFGLKSAGTTIDRCRRVEQAGWDWIYREDLRNAEALTPVERGLADRIAEESSLRMWHMRLVENFVAVTGSYVRQYPSADRFAETLLLLRSTIVQLKGKSPFPQPQLGDRRVAVRIGQPIGVTDRWDAYQANRKRAVADLTETLQVALEGLIVNGEGEVGGRG